MGNQEKQNRTQILNSTTRTSDPCRVGRSTFITSSSKKGDGMRNLLGSCVRTLLVAGPATSSRSHGARVACGRRSQEKIDRLFGLSRICFGSSAAAGRPQHTRYRPRLYRCSPSPWWSMHGCCVPAVYQSSPARIVGIRHSP